MKKRLILATALFSLRAGGLPTVRPIRTHRFQQRRAPLLPLP